MSAIPRVPYVAKSSAAVVLATLDNGYCPLERIVKQCDYIHAFRQTNSVRTG